MPSYKTKQVDEQGKAVYQDVCYPVTKEFREKLYSESVKQYETEKEKAEEQARDNAGKKMENPKNSRESLSMMVKETLCKKKRIQSHFL